MGSNFLDDPFGEIFHFATDIASDAYDILKDFSDSAWEDVIEPIVEDIFNILGFSEETVINGNVSVIRILGDSISPLPELALNAFKSEKNVNKLLNNFTVAGTPNSVRSYMSYGKNTYIDGLPITNLSYESTDLEEIERVIREEIELQPVVLTYDDLGETNEEFYLGFALQNSHSLIPSIGELQFNSVTWNLDYYEYDIANDSYIVHIKKTYLDIDSIEITDYSVLPESIGSFNASDYYNVRYTLVNDANSYEYLFTYERGSGLYIGLDTISDDSQRDLEMLPIVELRNNGVSISKEADEERYVTTQGILKKVGLDVEVLLDGLSENPDIASVTEVYVLFGVNVVEDNNVVNKVLFKAFEIMYVDPDLYNSVVTTTVDSTHLWQRRVVNDQPAFRNTVTNEWRYNQSLSDWFYTQEESFYYPYIRTTNVYFTSSLQQNNFNQSLKFDIMNRYSHEGSIGEVGTYTKTVTGENITVSKQVTPTDYISYECVNLGSLTLIRKDGEVAMVPTSPSKPDSFILPISFQHMEDLNAIEKHELTALSLHMVAYSAQVDVLKYYETPAFGQFIQFVGIIVTVVTLGADGGSVSALAIALVTTVASTAILKWVLEKTDNSFLRALAIIAYVAVNVFAGGQGPGGFAPITIITSALNSVTAVGGIYNEQKRIELLAEVESFRGEVAERQEELDKQQEIFSVSESSLFRTLRVTYPAESNIQIDGYFDRKLNTNPGVGLIDYDRVFDLSGRKSSSI